MTLIWKIFQWGTTVTVCMLITSYVTELYSWIKACEHSIDSNIKNINININININSSSISSKTNTTNIFGKKI